MPNLQGKPIVVTGASSGIGRAAAIACAKAGMPVVAAARREDRLTSLVAEISAAGGRAIAARADVAEASDCERLVSQCVDAFGSIYSVFANAGFGIDKPILDMTEIEMRRIFDVNFFGTMNIVRAAAARMSGGAAAANAPTSSERAAQFNRNPPLALSSGRGRNEARGHILICSSCLARFPMPGFGAYTATKAAQHHIGRAMRPELQAKGIRVTTVHPVGTRTEFFEVARPKEAGGTLSNHSPEAFMQTAEFVASRIVKCLERERPQAELWPGFTGQAIRTLFAASAAFPGTTDFLLSRALKKLSAR